MSMPTVKAPPKNLKPAKLVSIPKPSTSTKSAKKENKEENMAAEELYSKLEKTLKQVSSFIYLEKKNFVRASAVAVN